MVREIAAAHHAKPGQIALAWLLHKGHDVRAYPRYQAPQNTWKRIWAAETIRSIPCR